MATADPYIRPTLSALRASALQDIQTSALPGAAGVFTRSVLSVMSWVMAGFAWLHYDYLDFIYQQSNPWDATGAAALGWGGLIKVTPKPAVAAGSNGQGMASWSGTYPAPPAVVVLPFGTPLLRSDGALFTTTAEATVSSAGVVSAPVLAVVPGAAGNMPVGTQLVINAPVEGIASTGAVTAALTDGVDPEDIDTAFKARYLAQYAAPLQGGDAGDYVNWSLAVPGVTRAWVNPNGAGPGTVVIYTMFDVSEAASGGFPQGSNGAAAAEPRATAATGDQLTVADALYPLRPTTALVYSCAPINTPVAFAIANLAPNTPAVQAAIAAALAEMFLQLGHVGGTLEPSTMAAWPPIYPSDFDAAIDSVPGLLHCTVVAPAAPLTPATGQLLTLGALTCSG